MILWLTITAAMVYFLVCLKTGIGPLLLMVKITAHIYATAIWLPVGVRGFWRERWQYKYALERVRREL